MVESSGLLNRRRALKLYRGFESLPLRHPYKIKEFCEIEAKARKATLETGNVICKHFANALTRPRSSFSVSESRYRVAVLLVRAKGRPGTERQRNSAVQERLRRLVVLSGSGAKLSPEDRLVGGERQAGYHTQAAPWVGDGCVRRRPAPIVHVPVGYAQTASGRREAASETQVPACRRS